MASLIQWQDVFIFITYGFLVATSMQSRAQFAHCHAPIDKFIILTYIFVIVQQLSSMFLRRQQVQKPTKFYYINLTFYLALFPACLYTTIKGISWQFENDKYSPNCLPATNPRWIIWMLICLLLIWDLYFIALYGIMANRLRHYFITRPRMAQLIQRQSENKRLLDPESTSEEFENNQPELPEHNVNDIRTLEYTYSFVKSLNPLQKICPICFDNIIPRTEIAELPHCTHNFHPSCIKTWIEKNPLCPVCVLESKGIITIQPKSNQGSATIEMGANINRV